MSIKDVSKIRLLFLKVVLSVLKVMFKSLFHILLKPMVVRTILLSKAKSLTVPSKCSLSKHFIVLNGPGISLVRLSLLILKHQENSCKNGKITHQPLQIWKCLRVVKKCLRKSLKTLKKPFILQHLNSMNCTETTLSNFFTPILWMPKQKMVNPSGNSLKDHQHQSNKLIQIMSFTQHS